jgi:UDP-3-O-[3-hydroxymyristoyl] glucosamine N-acyltransferase
MPSINEMIAFLKAKASSRFLVPEAGGLLIRRAASIIEAGPEDVTFCGGTAKDLEGLVHQSRGGLLIVDERIKVDMERLSENGVKALISSPNARLSFIRLTKHFFSPLPPTGIHASAVISPKARIGKEVYIGPLCSIGEAEIGDSCIIHAGVHLYDGVRIGNSVIIHSGTVIGSEGFGYERSEAGQWERFPHLGGVVIEEDVEIGSNTCIDRGTLGDTRICKGARIDNLVHISHNVYIGKHAIVIANAMVGGGTRIEDHAWISPSASLRDRIRIGPKAMVGFGAVVTEDVAENSTVLGIPAREISKYKRLLTLWNAMLERSEERGE